MTNEIPGGFQEINDRQGLSEYLTSKARLENRLYLYHYTSLSAAINIIKSNKWFFGNAKNMNDRLEYDQWSVQEWEKLFYVSFVGEGKESIGMWSMYGRPLETGVKIAIPRKSFLEWVKSVKGVREVARQNDRFVVSDAVIDMPEKSCRTIAVAYCDYDNRSESEFELSWSNQKNKRIPLSEILGVSELVGHVKDSAWSYEKEVRFAIAFEKKATFTRLAVDVPDAIINDFVLTPSPLFEGDLREEIRKEIEKSDDIKIEYSLFANKISGMNQCGICRFRPGAS